MKKIMAAGLIVLAGAFMLPLSNVTAQSCYPDSYNPPCEGNLDFDCDVDAEDVTKFLEGFGRGRYYQPCPPIGPAMVQKTGQTTSYATGDDGNLERGVPWPDPRFIDNLDGTVSDNLTGLIWLKDANCFAQRMWNDSLSDCNGLASGSCGLTDGSQTADWRLPSRFELESLINLEYFLPSLSNTVGSGQWSEDDIFNNVQSEFYWSSTTYPGSSTGASGVNMGDGSAYGGGKGTVNYVWCVRGGR